MAKKRVIPRYITPDGATCPNCDEPCEIIPLQNEFAYSGTHATYGLGGNHYPEDWGSPVSSCCEAPMES